MSIIEKAKIALKWMGLKMHLVQMPETEILRTPTPGTRVQIAIDCDHLGFDELSDEMENFVVRSTQDTDDMRIEETDHSVSTIYTRFGVFYPKTGHFYDSTDAPFREPSDPARQYDAEVAAMENTNSTDVNNAYDSVTRDDMENALDEIREQDNDPDGEER